MFFSAVISSEEFELAATLPIAGGDSAVALTLVFDTVRDSTAATAQLPAQAVFQSSKSSLWGRGGEEVIFK